MSTPGGRNAAWTFSVYGNDDYHSPWTGLSAITSEWWPHSGFGGHSVASRIHRTIYAKTRLRPAFAR